jgi:hypothetical protein
MPGRLEWGGRESDAGTLEQKPRRWTKEAYTHCQAMHLVPMPLQSPKYTIPEQPMVVRQCASGGFGCTVVKALPAKPPSSYRRPECDAAAGLGRKTPVGLVMPRSARSSRAPLELRCAVAFRLWHFIPQDDIVWAYEARRADRVHLAIKLLAVTSILVLSS